MSLRCSLTLIGTTLGAAGLASCQPADRAPEADVVEVTARDYSFEVAAEIPSGWTTFRMKNEGNEHHFFLLNRLPEGKTFEDYVGEVGVAFETAWDSLRTSAMDKAEAGQLLGSLLPAWYPSVQAMGGVGLVAPGGVAQTSLNLDPGSYVMECYVKTRDGIFHTSLGMTRPFTVTRELSGASAPKADIEVVLSNYEIAIEGETTPGEHTVAVRFEEHPEFGLGNDVHLARLKDQVEIGEVAQWMDWMELSGLRAPAPAEFLGGAQEMPVGHSAYFTVNLEPGRYGWITEASADKGMFKEFTVER
jgi:hypothetical protein